MQELVINAANLCVNVKEKQILKNVSFSARKGEVMAPVNPLPLNLSWSYDAIIWLCVIGRG